MKIVVLDRDGVINQDSDDYIKSADELIPIPGSIEAIARLSRAGFTVAVATNQSGLARKLFDEQALSDMHHKLCSMVQDAGGLINCIFYCPHLPDDHCQCRKPKTGLLEKIEKELKSTLAGSFFVGDSLKDIESALAFRCKPILVRTGKGHGTENEILLDKTLSIPIFDDLANAVTQILAWQDAE